MYNWFNDFSKFQKDFNNKKDFVNSKFEEKFPEIVKEFYKLKTNLVNTVLPKKNKVRRDPARPW